MSIRAWVSEIGIPHKRCARKGHVPREQVRYGYAYPCRADSGWLGGVADRITEERTYCARCGEDIEPWHEKDWVILSGLSTSAERWRLLKRDGRLF